VIGNRGGRRAGRVGQIVREENGSVLAWWRATCENAQDVLDPEHSLGNGFLHKRFRERKIRRLSLSLICHFHSYFHSCFAGRGLAEG
jgi:hypothetical protein